MVNAKDLSTHCEMKKKYGGISEYFRFKKTNIIVYDRKQTIADIYTLDRGYRAAEQMIEEKIINVLLIKIS